MEHALEGKVAVVTGAVSGIGQAFRRVLDVNVLGVMLTGRAVQMLHPAGGQFTG